MGENEGDASLTGVCSVAGQLIFSHIQNVCVQKLQAKLTARCAKVFSFLNPPLGALPLYPAGGSA